MNDEQSPLRPDSLLPQPSTVRRQPPGLPPAPPACAAAGGSGDEPPRLLHPNLLAALWPSLVYQALLRKRSPRQIARAVVAIIRERQQEADPEP